MPKIYGKDGQQAVEDLDDYVEGINAYIAAAKLNPQLKPAEYTLLNKPMEPWKPTDVIAIASLVGGIFGRGGGNELNSALTMEAMVERMGKQGRAQGLARLPLEERPGSADDDRQAASPTRPAAPSPSAAWRCPTPGSVHEPTDRLRQRRRRRPARA